MSFELRKLEDVCDILDHMRIPITSRDRKEGPYPYYGANGIQDYIDDFIFDDELVLLAEDGGNFGSKEKPIAYRISGKTWVNNHAHVLKPKNIIDVDYLCYSLMYYDVSGLVNGATRQKLTQSEMRKINIRYRSLEKQRQMVFKIKLISNIISSREHQLSNLNLLVKSRFVEMFGDPVTNPLHWPICLLGEQIKFITSGSRGWAKYFTNEGAYFITIKNVKNSNIKVDDMQYIIPPNNAEAIRTKVQEGDLLISITADLGRTGVVSKEIAEHGGYINQHLTCIRLNQENVNPLYVSYYMESEAGKRQFNLKNQSAVKAGLNFDSIRSLNLMLPPIELQHDYISFVKQVDKSKFVVTAKFQ